MNGMKVLQYCCLFVMSVLVMGFPVQRGGISWRKSSAAVKWTSSGRKNVPGKTPPTILSVISVDASDSNNASSWTQRQAWGDGEPVSRLDYLVTNSELRVRGEQLEAYRSLEASIATLSSKTEASNKKIGEDIQAIKYQLIIVFIIFGAIASQIPSVLQFLALALRLLPVK
jgi:hypothetical protein